MHSFAVTARSKDGLASTSKVSYTVLLPTNHFTVFHIKTHRDGTITFEVKVPGAGRIDVMETAWDDNLARAAVLLQPAPHRFVFARAHKTARQATTLDPSDPQRAREPARAPPHLPWCARTQPVLATVPVDVTVPLASDGLWLAAVGGLDWGDAAVVAEARPEGRAGAAIAACAPSVTPPRARSSLSTDNWRPGGWCRFRPPR